VEGSYGTIDKQAMNSKRLEVLLKMTAKEDADSFAWYALALEYKGLSRIDDAFAAFQKLRSKDESYVPMYLMCGTMLIEANRPAEAKEWLAAGLAAARKKGDGKAAGEIEAALAGL
jgi:predicted Zn-dependent protease